MVAAACATLSAPVRAQPNADELAHRNFESGVAYLQESDYENALKAFEKSYQLSKRPEILLNLATVHERLGQLQLAVDALEEYLRKEPDGEHADTVRVRIANLQKNIAKRDAAKKSEPPPPPPPKKTTEKADGTEREPPAAKPDRTIPYVALGLGGLAAGGAVLTGILAKGEYDSAKDECDPHCQESDVSSGKSLAMVSTVLTGVAAVGVGVGVILLLTEKPTAEKPPSSAGVPHFDVALGPRGAAAGPGARSCPTPPPR